jgi:uncharacterized paraquat-inducible protein A
MNCPNCETMLMDGDRTCPRCRQRLVARSTRGLPRPRVISCTMLCTFVGLYVSLSNNYGLEWRLIGMTALIGFLVGGALDLCDLIRDSRGG